MLTEYNENKNTGGGGHIVQRCPTHLPLVANGHLNVANIAFSKYFKNAMF
jgi:hypothetical protein